MCWGYEGIVEVSFDLARLSRDECLAMIYPQVAANTTDTGLAYAAVTLCAEREKYGTLRTELKVPGGKQTVTYLEAVGGHLRLRGPYRT